MRFLHLSDLHIGKQLHGYSLAEDQEYILRQIIRLAAERRPDGILIAGDVFDRSVPAGEAYIILDRFLEGLADAVPDAFVFIIAGNHDSPERLGYARGFLCRHHIYVSTLPPQSQEEHLVCVPMEDSWGTVNVWMMPFVKPGLIPEQLWPEGCRSQSTDDAVRLLLARERIDTSQRNVILAHQLFVHEGERPVPSDSEQLPLQIGGLDQVEAESLSAFEYGALGHIHRPQFVGGGDALHQYRYCGTPLQYSVGEAGQEKSVTLITLERKGSPVCLETIKLEPLRQVRRLEGTLQELLAGTMTDDYVSITLMDEGELFQPREQLEEVYHRILELRVRSGFAQLLSEEEQVKRSPLELFEDFYREIWNQEMSEEEHRYLEEVMTDEALTD